MSFPNFDTNDFNNNDEIQVEQMHPGQPTDMNFMMNNAPSDNFFNMQQGSDSGFGWAQNVPSQGAYANFDVVVKQKYFFLH